MMKEEQINAIIFLIAGIITGIISFYLNILSSLLFGSLMYLGVTAIVFKKLIKNKKLINESFIIFILIWILVWIILNSL